MALLVLKFTDESAELKGVGDGWETVVGALLLAFLDKKIDKPPTRSRASKMMMPIKTNLSSTKKSLILFKPNLDF